MLKPIFGLEIVEFPIYAAMLVLGGLVALIMLNSRLGQAGYSPFMRKVARGSVFWSALAA